MYGFQPKQKQFRSMNEIMMWSHAFLGFEIIRGINVKEYNLAIIGTSTFFLSLMYHRCHETRCQPVESYFAKTTMFYLLVSSFLKFDINDFLDIAFLTLLCFIVYKFSHPNPEMYEFFHPFLHILVAITCHEYITKYGKWRQETEHD